MVFSSPGLALPGRSRAEKAPAFDVLFREGASESRQYPLFGGEFGADVKKIPFIPAAQQEDPAAWAPAALGMVQKYGLSWT